jgi:hypothetical protein
MPETPSVAEEFGFEYGIRPICAVLNRRINDDKVVLEARKDPRVALEQAFGTFFENCKDLFDAAMGEQVDLSRRPPELKRSAELEKRIGDHRSELAEVMS